MNSKAYKILLLTIVLALMLTTAVNAATFNDISDHWAKSYIEKVAKKGLVSGYSNGTFKPEENVTVLEALVMLSRLYDIDEDIMDEIIEEYEPVLEDMPNTKDNEWSFEYLSVVIELGIVSESGMEKMFKNKSIFQPATKEEISILMAKAMMLGEEAEELKVYTLPFKDVAEISTAARPYIYIMYDRDILQGDNNKKINPKDKITRAVMATMLDRAYEYIDDEEIEPNFENYQPTTIISGTITEISEGSVESYINILKNNEETVMVKINDDTKFKLNGKSSKFSKLDEDMTVTCKINDKNIALSIEADDSVKIVRGIISYVAYSSPASITIKDEDGDKLKFNVSSDVDVYLDGKETELKNLDDDDEITLMIEDDRVVQINSISRIQHYDGVITAINYASFPIKLSIKTNDGKVMTFEFNSDVDVTRNDDDSSFDQVRVGDIVTVTTKYGEMIRINTEAAEAELSGTIKEILIAPISKIKIADEDGDVEEYSISNNVKINLGEKNATIYDLRLGYHVYVNTSGDEIATIEASELQTAKNFSGKVIYVNSDEKLIMMQNIKENGQTELIHLRVTNSTKIFDTSGKTEYMKNIEEGENIISTALSQGGEYVAVSIMLQ
ncbi:S-layer homology domain-containing protein [Sedimentibacter sp. MB31-C6]|uniref:S-layer homology domain-containing protein n=1 Tax=Sedimentibacter sp. MB31-C6 TaxID=3109366 RepID=UPI002DDD0A79|nr:S-layer homology domain-containing protein [Sedimentibacter sp. MB36-C1]WSI05340.1 S-layer homology domain-containing protein [Sedimentibacter sp. MB36-C1]